MATYAIYEKGSGGIDKIVSIPEAYIDSYPLPDDFDYIEVDETVNDVTHIIMDNQAVKIDTTAN